jgi:hypothetical protein
VATGVSRPQIGEEARRALAALTPDTIERHPDGAAVTYCSSMDPSPGWSGVVVATLKHGSEFVNTALLAEAPSFMVDARCSHVTRVRVTVPPSDGRWRIGDEVDVPTMWLAAGD